MVIELGRKATVLHIRVGSTGRLSRWWILRWISYFVWRDAMRRSISGC